VQVPYGEGVAIHIGPEPCADVRKGVGETLSSRVPTQFRMWKAIRTGAPLASAWTTRRGHRPWHVQKLLYGNREVPRPAGSARNACCSGPHREGEEPKPMMHDRGKSDSAIVAVKPTNNAGQPAAEPVEPRAGTKRNAGEQSTAPDTKPDSCDQALARVRKAAQQRTKEK